jgi:mRNA interferase MazF
MEALAELGHNRYSSASARMDTKTDPQPDKAPLAIRRGDIFWIDLDEPRGSVPGIAHPHVVIQEDVFNRSRILTVVVCALTSNLKRASEPGNVLLDVGEGNLPRQSVLVVSQVSSVYKTQLGEHIGSLSDERIEQVLAGMRFQQASFFNGR